jgi:phosphoglycerate dehydrogenase-like enzyme
MLLAQSDFVTLHCPLNQETHHLINATTLGKMKPTAILINTTRGGTVDQAALFQALTSGQIAAAGLDVTSPEPLPTDHPLLTLPNCVILPHIGSASIATRTKMALMAAENVIAGVEGRPLPNSVW